MTVSILPTYISLENVIKLILDEQGNDSAVHGSFPQIPLIPPSLLLIDHLCKSREKFLEIVNLFFLFDFRGRRHGKRYNKLRAALQIKCCPA